jgi:hypothetical protein
MVQIAVHDALNAIEPRYARYTGIGLANPGASPDAAVAAAARQTLLALLAPLPDSALKQAAINTIENAYAATVGPPPHDAATQAGIDAGEAAADAILTRPGQGLPMFSPDGRSLAVAHRTAGIATPSGCMTWRPARAAWRSAFRRRFRSFFVRAGSTLAARSWSIAARRSRTW